MAFLFGKKQLMQALAETLEDGRALANEEMKKPKYREYSGAEPMLEVAVRVQPEAEPPFEAQMKVGISHSYLLKAGVRVLVTYEAGKHDHVKFDDQTQAILERNPQLIKTA